MRRGLGRHMYRNSGNIFTPLSLFAAGEQGAWYDPSNFSTLFQDSTGTTPVTAVEQPVGLMLDGSKGLALGPQLVSNGTFDSNINGWTAQFTSTASWQAGALRSISSGTNAGEASTPITCVVGSTYRVTGTVVGGTSSGRITASSSAFGGSGGSYVSSGSQTFYFVATATTMYIVCGNGSSTNGFYCDFDNITAQLIPGNHAFQATPANRPTLSARYNLLTKSQQYDDAAWTKSNSFVQTNLLTYSEQFDNAAWATGNVTVTANAVAAPDGSLTADSFIPSASAATTYAQQSFTSTAQAYTFSVYVKTSNVQYVQLAWSAAQSAQYTNFDLFGVQVATSTTTTAAITPAGNGWYRLSISSTLAVAAGNVDIFVVPAGNSARSASYTGNGTSGIYIWGAQLVQGSVPGDYRATTSAALPVLYADPIGGVTAEKLCEDSTTNFHYVAGTGTTVASTVYTASVSAKAGERNWIALSAHGIINGTAYFNLATGAKGTVNAGITSSSISSIGNGYYRCSIVYTATGVANALDILPATADNVSSYTGDGSSGIYVWGSDLRPANDGVGLPAYQRVNTSTDYDTAGFPPYLLANGSTTSLATNSIDFSATNKMTVWAGVRKLVDIGNYGTVCEFANRSANGSFGMYGPDLAANTYSFVSQGTPSVGTAVSAATYSAPITNVLTGIGDIAAPSAAIRVNGTQTNNTATQGTGNYGNYPLYIGARAGTSLFFNGRLYSLIVRGASTTATTLSNAETWVNSKTKAY